MNMFQKDKVVFSGDRVEPCDLCEICNEAPAEECINQTWRCDQCAKDYREDHPDPEEAVARAEWYRDSGAFGYPER